MLLLLLGAVALAVAVAFAFSVAVAVTDIPPTVVAVLLLFLLLLRILLFCLGCGGALPALLRFLYKVLVGPRMDPRSTKKSASEGLTKLLYGKGFMGIYKALMMSQLWRSFTRAT